VSTDLDPQIRNFFTGGRALGLYLLHFDATKKIQDDTKGFFRTKQAGRTGLGTVMREKKI